MVVELQIGVACPEIYRNHFGRCCIAQAATRTLEIEVHSTACTWCGRIVEWAGVK